jgi:BirA family biotin operon repressor/biotin-[acetyl-CoA-carboxylase] ligase
VDREVLLVELLRRFDGLYARADDPAVLDRYRHRSATIGRRVRVELPDGPAVGEARDVTDEGHLVVEISGRMETFAAADVVHLRPAD